MYKGLLLLSFAYILSQFFRAFLTVIASPLEAELGIGPETLAMANGLWFISFALMQIPVGYALDTIGPRRTTSICLLLGGVGGSLLFSLAQSALQLHFSMIFIGIGCAPVLMAGYYIFAREFEVKKFATLAASMIGIGSLGNLLASYPMTLAEATIGWRNTMVVLAAICGLIGAAIFVFVKDPKPIETQSKGSVLDLFKIPTIWLIIPIAITAYVPAAALRGSWLGPYLRDVHGFNADQIGTAALIMGLAMIGGVFAYGPLDRWLGTRKWVVVGGNLLSLTCLLSLWFWGADSAFAAIALMAGVGLFGATFPVIMAHGKGVFPAHLTGRGVTLLNMFSIGGVGLGQFIAKGLNKSYAQDVNVLASYNIVFILFSGCLALGIIIYSLSRDNAN